MYSKVLQQGPLETPQGPLMEPHRQLELYQQPRLVLKFPTVRPQGCMEVRKWPPEPLHRLHGRAEKESWFLIGFQVSRVSTLF